MDRHKKHHSLEDEKHKQEGKDESAQEIKESSEKDNATTDAGASLHVEEPKKTEAGSKGEDIRNNGEGAAKDKELQKIKLELDTLKDLMQRRQADFENYKKRQLKIQQDQKKFAIKDLALDIILMNDDLLRAIEAASTIQKDITFEQAHESFVQGVSMISKRLEETLKKYGIIEIDSINQAFDPNFCEAVEIEMSQLVTSDMVTKVYQKGFRIDDLVLRHAKVRVSKPVAKAENVANDKGADSGLQEKSSDTQEAANDENF